MITEINDILAAFKEAHLNGRQTALATVVHVEGSSYRRPGARMLVEDNGQLTGAISGGCLEGDALRKAMLAITQQRNKIVTYNTLDDDDNEFGVQLGCNGIVHILFEPIDITKANNAITLLESCVMHRKDAVLCTLFSLKNYSGSHPGTCLFYDGMQTQSSIHNSQLASAIEQEAATVLSSKTPLWKTYIEDELTAFVEFMEPPVSLVVVGAGNDALPIVKMAGILGWQTTIIDGRVTHANKQRFPGAHRILVGKPAEAMQQVTIDERTVFVLMTHNFNYDLDMLGLLLQKRCRYIGTLGPKKRLEKILAGLSGNGLTLTEAQRSGIYGPTGLDIGAETAEEIALSVLAEIQAVLMNRRGNSLRNRPDAIHARSASETIKVQSSL